jgi:glycosyltransferase involved in cell wall biosynthesis
MISAQFVPEKFGGAIHQCLKLSKQLMSEGWHITVLTSRSSFKLPYKEDIEGIHVIRIWTGAPPQLMNRYILSSLISFIGCFFWFIVHHRQIDVIHIHQAKFQAVIGALLGKWFKKPSIVKAGNAIDLASLKRKVLCGNTLYAIVKDNITKFIALSSQIQEAFKNYGINENKILNIPNGVYQTLSIEEIQQRKQGYRFRLFGEEANTCAHCKYFLSAGRLSKEKNIPLLVTAFAEASINIENIRLVILGDGTLQEEIKSLIEQKKITNKVVFKGYTYNVADYMVASDFFVLPSETEGMSNSLLEAMSMALIPISTNISGSSDLIENKKNGFLIDKPWDVNLKEAINYCAQLDNDYQEKMRRESFYTIKKKYTMEHVAKQYISLYNTLLEFSIIFPIIFPIIYS